MCNDCVYIMASVSYMYSLNDVMLVPMHGRVPRTAFKPTPHRGVANRAYSFKSLNCIMAMQ